MATSKVSVTEGSGKNVATHSISEDAVTKELQRVVPSTSAGVELDTIANPSHIQIVDHYAFQTENTPMGEIRTAEPTRLVGALFEGATLDTNFWTSTVANSATTAQANAQIVLTSGTNSAGSVKVASVRRARYVPGIGIRYRAVIQLGDTGTANNTKIWGVGYGASMPTITDGAYFKSVGTTFSVVTKKTNSETAVNSGSFNGAAASYSLDTNAHTYEIYWTNSKVYFVIDGVLIHTVSAAAATWADTMSHYIYLENTNSGNTTSVTLSARVLSISRLGKIETAPIWKNINTTAVTALILKRGAGRLHHVAFNTLPNGCSVSLYDALTATNPIAVIVPPNGSTAFTQSFDLDFFNGLTVTTAVNATDVTIVYE